MYGIEKSAALRTVAAIPSACFKIGIEPYNLMTFLHKFEQFVINSKAKNQKEVFENVRSSLDTYFSFVRRKNELKEEIAGLEATQRRRVQRRSAHGQVVQPSEMRISRRPLKLN